MEKKITLSFVKTAVDIVSSLHLPTITNSMEENNDKSIDLNFNAEQRDQETPEDDNNEPLNDLKEQLEEIYDARIHFMNAVNQIKKRKVNLALIIIQFFSRYDITHIIGFLGAGISVVILQGLSAAESHFQSTLLIGVMITMLMTVFLIVTLINVFSALSDIKRIKQGFCTMGYQIVERKDSDDESSDNSSLPPIIAYKDNVNMIRTIKFPDLQNKKYFVTPVLTLFLDNNNPYKVTLFDDMPRNITYEYKSQTFTQEWKDAICTLVPAAMIIIFSISAYFSYVAYTMLHQ